MKTKIIFLFAITATFLIPNDALSFKQRLDHKGEQRTIELAREFYDVSKEYEIPLEILVGIAYNESNSRVYAIGDAGYAFSLTQIRCATDGRRFSWMPFLRKKGVNIKKCSDLLDSEISLKSTAIILRHHHKREKNWDKAVKAFHLGFNWRSDRPRTNHYLKRVKYFGKQLEEKVRLRAKVFYVIAEIDHWLDQRFTKIKKLYNFHFA